MHKRAESAVGKDDGQAGDKVREAIAVALQRCASYSRPLLEKICADALEAAGWKPEFGCRLLIKPNLLRAQADGLCCTHPEVVRAAVIYAQACGARVTVGDSPAFGSAVRVADSIGLLEALKGLDAPVVTLDSPVSCILPSGIGIGIARLALESDVLLNLPRVKAHSQMRLTLAVKNLFGCVSGVNKAIAHTKHGDRGNRFESMIVELDEMLPPTAALVDGITCMHRTGPSGGDPYSLGLIGASTSCIALDTALYSVLQLQAEDLPLWAELQRRSALGAFAADLMFPLLKPEDFEAADFEIPHQLKPVSFRPATLLRSLARRIWHRYGPSSQ